MKIFCSIVLVLLCGMAMLSVVAQSAQIGGILGLNALFAVVGLAVRWQWAKSAHAFTLKAGALALAASVGLVLVSTASTGLYLLTPYNCLLSVAGVLLSMAVFAALATPWRREAVALSKGANQ